VEELLEASIPWKLSVIFALLSPNAFTALHLQLPPSAMVGLDISRLSKYVSFPASFFVILIRSLRFICFEPKNHLISGKG